MKAHGKLLRIGVQNDKRPRHYAAEILALPSREDRQAAIDQVPEHYREWVMLYVRMWWHKREEFRDAQSKN